MGAHWTPRSALAFAAVLAVLLLTFGWLIGTFDLHAFLQAARTVRGGHSPYAQVQSSDRVMFVAALLAGIMISPIVWSSYLLILDIPLLVVAVDDRPLAVAALASWVLVVPDVVSPPRVVVGAGLALLLSALPWRQSLDRRWRQDGTARGAWPLVDPARYAAIGLLALMVLTLIVSPAGVLNALPVVLGMAAVGAEVVGAVRSRHRVASIALPESELMGMTTLLAHGGRTRTGG
jgi:ABC-type phosphate transport system permease subunit